MCQKVENNPRMTDVEASERFPDSYIIMNMDSITSSIGTVLYIGDNEDEIISLVMTLDEPFCGVLIGLNHQHSLGGVVVGG